MLGVERILSASAVGSLKEEYQPLDIVVPDQFFDRTKGRISTFFGRGLVAHIAFAHPVCGDLSAIAADAAEAVGATVHRGGTYVNMEGPQFSTLAESKLYRSWGMDVIGMTNLQEAKLAREAEICYATLALVTDYDCWHPDHDSVTVDLIIANLMQNAATAQKTIAEAVSRLRRPRTCACKDALATAIITRPEHVPDADEEGAGADHREVHEILADRSSITINLSQLDMNIVVTGSIAFDYLMSFPGKFTEHFLPEHMHRVSLSFLVDTMDKRRGGCAPNIAYTLALLGERPLLMATAGEDFGEYRAVARSGRRRHVAREAGRRASSPRRSSAAPTRTTTRSRRSTPARWPTPASCRSATSRDCGLAIISPNDPGRDGAVRRGVPDARHPLHLRSRASSARGCPATSCRTGVVGATDRHLQRLRVRAAAAEDRAERGRRSSRRAKR